MDAVFKALSDPHRRELLDRLNRCNGQTLQELCADLAMSRQAVSKHLAILEAASLVATVRRGREKLHYLNAAPIHEIADRWIRPFDRGRVEALADLKHALEQTMPEHPDRPEFVYVSYIRTSPERLWAALTEPAFTRRYWDMTFESDVDAGLVDDVVPRRRRGRAIPSRWCWTPTRRAASRTPGTRSRRSGPRRTTSTRSCGRASRWSHGLASPSRSSPTAIR